MQYAFGCSQVGCRHILSAHIVTFGAAVVDVSEAAEIECFVSQWETYHTAEATAPTTVEVGVGAGTFTRVLIGYRHARHIILLEAEVTVEHPRALRLLIEVVESQVDIMVERGFEVGVTNADAHRVAEVGHGLKLSNRRLACASAIVNLEAACFAEFVAETSEWCRSPQPRCGDVTLRIEQVAALLHGAHELQSGIEVVFCMHFLEAELYGLAKEFVAELAALGLIEDVEFLAYVEIAFENIE